MNLSLAYPSVPVFLQSSILLNKGEGRDSTPTETALGAFQIAAAQPRRGPRAHNYALSMKFLTGLRERTYAVGIKFLWDVGEWMGLDSFYLAIGVCRNFMTAGSTCQVGRNSLAAGAACYCKRKMGQRQTESVVIYKDKRRNQPGGIKSDYQ